MAYFDTEGPGSYRGKQQRGGGGNYWDITEVLRNIDSSSTGGGFNPLSLFGEGTAGTGAGAGAGAGAGTAIGAGAAAGAAGAAVLEALVDFLEEVFLVDFLIFGIL